MNIFHTFFQCFYCWFWTNKCWDTSAVYSQRAVNYSKYSILTNVHIVLCSRNVYDVVIRFLSNYEVLVNIGMTCINNNDTVMTLMSVYPAKIYLFKVNNRNTRKRCEMCSKLTIKKQERRCRRSSVFIVNFELISHLFLVFY